MKFDPERLVALLVELIEKSDYIHHALDKTLLSENLGDLEERVGDMSWEILEMHCDARAIVAYVFGGEQLCANTSSYPACNNVVTKMEALIQKWGPFCSECEPILTPICDRHNSDGTFVKELMEKERRMAEERKATRREKERFRTSDEALAHSRELKKFHEELQAKRKKKLEELRRESEELEDVA